MDKLVDAIEDIQERIDFFRETGRPVPALLEVRLIGKKHKLETGKKLKKQLLPWYTRKAMIKNTGEKG